MMESACGSRRSLIAVQASDHERLRVPPQVRRHCLPHLKGAFTAHASRRDVIGRLGAAPTGQYAGAGM
jgi:hypothetical protein